MAIDLCNKCSLPFSLPPYSQMCAQAVSAARKEGRAARARRGAYLQTKTAQEHDRQIGERFNVSKIE
jgi:hypothetical protein